MSRVDLVRVRPVLRKQAEAASTLDPNLAQGLALVGGVPESNILRRYLLERRQLDPAMSSDEEHLRLVYAAHSLLTIRPSRLAARTLVDAIRRGSPWTKQVAARLVSMHLLGASTVPVERMLLRALPTLLVADDDCFANALPILLQRHFAEATKRCSSLFKTGAPATRRSLVLALLGVPYYGLELILEAFKSESQLDVRVSIAAAVGPAIPKAELFKLARQALDDASPATRLSGVRILAHLEPREARKLSKRRDPESVVEKALREYRGRGRRVSRRGR